MVEELQYSFQIKARSLRQEKGTNLEWAMDLWLRINPNDCCFNGLLMSIKSDKIPRTGMYPVLRSLIQIGGGQFKRKGTSPVLFTLYR